MNAQSDGVGERARVAVGIVRFAGDSGDGIQLMGARFTHVAAERGYDLATVPDYPAEIRAPSGTTFGVSSFQIRFGGEAVRNPGDLADTLVAMNPAALKVHLGKVREGGTVVLNTGTFNEKNLKRAGMERDPREDGSLRGYRLVAADIGGQTLEAVSGLGLSRKNAGRCRNMYALGLVLWMYGAGIEPARAWIEERFGKDSAVGQANLRALVAGHAFGETAELTAGAPRYDIDPADLPAGLYRTITGGEALAFGLVVGAHKVGRPLFFGSYPITPASPVLHRLAALHDNPDVTVFQAEDEIAAMAACLGASYAGSLAGTATSGPGLALKTEALTLACAAELPMVVIDCQRSGPSTGLPTKSEQTDLLNAIWGRPGEAPLPVLAPSSPSDCFATVVEAARIAVRFMTPVIVLADGYLVNAAEPWRLPDVAEIAPEAAKLHTEPEGFHPFLRDERLARPWAIPGTPGLEHRIGGLERDADSGEVSYDPENHQRMTDLRAAKVAGIADALPEQRVEVGPPTGKLAVVSWGSTYGVVREAVEMLRTEGEQVSQIHLRCLYPLPRGLGDLLAGFERVVVAELNSGHLRVLLRAEFLVDADGLNQVNGMPFLVRDVVDGIRGRLK